MAHLLSFAKIERIEIRGHHLLCLLGFRGLGYSPDFVENMKKVASTTLSSHSAIIRVVDRGDAICSACPYFRDGECHKKRGSAKRVATKDQKVIAKLGLLPGAELDAAELWTRVKENITPGCLQNLCSRCQWWNLGYCNEGLKGIKDGNNVAGTFVLQDQGQRS